MKNSNSLPTPESRILYFIEYLKESGAVRFKEEIYTKTGILRQYCNSVGNGDKRFTTNHIQAICSHYPINANWIFGTSEKMLLSENTLKPLATTNGNRKKRGL